MQQNNDDGDIDYVQYEPKESASFWDHVNPNRMSVPRYQTTFKIAVWFIYLYGERDSRVQTSVSLILAQFTRRRCRGRVSAQQRRLALTCQPS